MTDITEGVHDVLIVGSGPAGLTAAIYAARANLNPVMIEGAEAGGQLMITTDVENFPGFPQGIMGPDLIQVIRDQALRFGTAIETGFVESTDLSARPFVSKLADGREVRSQTVIISTGATARLLDLPAVGQLMGRGVSACATCDGFFFKEKVVAVIGGGDSAMEEGTFLTKFASKVHIIHRRDTLRASKIMQERALKNPKIEFIWDTVLADIYDPAQEKVTGLRLKNVKDGTERDFACDGLFFAIGHDPNTGFLGGQVETDGAGFIKVRPPSTQTSVAGVFACGDVMDPTYKQAITAAGTGCAAAIDAERFLEAEKG